MKRREAYRRFYVLAVAALMVAVQTGMIYVILHYNYNQDLRTQLYLRGHLFVLVLYALVLIILSGNDDALL